MKSCGSYRLRRPELSPSLKRLSKARSDGRVRELRRVRTDHRHHGRRAHLVRPGRYGVCQAAAAAFAPIATEAVMTDEDDKRAARQRLDAYFAWLTANRRNLPMAPD